SCGRRCGSLRRGRSIACRSARSSRRSSASTPPWRHRSTRCSSGTRRRTSSRLTAGSTRSYKPVMAQPGVFQDVIKHDRTPDTALPVDAFLHELDAFIATHSPYTQNEVVPAIGAGRASLEIVRRYAKELYYLGLWMTPEFPLLVANAPDTDAFSMADSEHYLH